jgi:hypothetical protein
VRSFSPLPAGFQVTRLKLVDGGRPPMLYADMSATAALSACPRLSSPRSVSAPFGPENAASSFSG